MKNLFNVIYSKNQTLIDAAMAPLVAKKVKRKIESAIDNSVAKIMDEQNNFLAELQKIEAMDLNNIKKIKTTINEAYADIEMMNDLHEMLFATRITVENIPTLEEAIAEAQEKAVKEAKKSK